MAALAVCALVVLGATVRSVLIRAILLLSLLLVPDLPSGQSLGLLVHWSAGLTLSNFIIPALGLPLMAGAWLAGKRLLARPWPGFATWSLLLLGWCLLTLAAPAVSGQVSGAQAATLLAHLAKLAVFLLLGVVLASPDDEWRQRAGTLLIVGIAGNDAIGLAQAAGWLTAFSPLAQASAGNSARASGLFYDANMYGVLCAWALLWLLTCTPGAGLRDRRSFQSWRAFFGYTALVAATAANLLASESRAGFAALAAGAGILLWLGQRRAVARVVLLMVLAAALFPQRTWHRVSAALATLDSAASSAGPVGAHSDASTAQRLASMDQALHQIAAHPLLGLGFGRSLYLGVQQLGTGTVRPALQGDFQGAQNMGLTVLTETGPVGLLLFLLALAAPLRRLAPLARESSAAAVMLAGFVGMLVACFTIEELWNARVLAQVVMLTAGGLAAVRADAAELELAA